MPGIRKLSFTLLAAATFTATIHAQQAPSPSAQDLEKLKAIASQVQAALQQGDLTLASRHSIELSTSIFRIKQSLEPTAQDKFAALERSVPASGKERFYALTKLAKGAYDAGEYAKSESYARELLGAAAAYRQDWNYGNAVFIGNMVIGRVALQRDHNVALAKSSLLAAAETPGSPQLKSFGPNMSLAKDLLAQGEQSTVLQFFMLCRNFWTMGPGKLDNWSATVKGGGVPDFGGNLSY